MKIQAVFAFLVLGGGFLVSDFSVAFAEPVEVPPLVLKPDVPTSTEYRKQKLSLAMAEIDLYPKHTKDKPAVQEIAMRYLVRAAHLEAEMPASLCPEDCRVADVIALAKEVLEAGSADPLVLRYSVDTLLHQVEDSVLTERIEQSIKGFEESSYPPLFRAKYAVANFNVIQHRSKMRYLIPVLETMHQTMPDYLEWAMAKPGCERAVYHNLISDMQLGFQFNRIRPSKLFREWVPKYNSLESKDEWLALMLMGKRHRDMAWAARGTNYAYKSKDWVNFKKQYDIAIRNFRAAYELHPERPESAEGILWGIRAGYDGEESMWDWFQRCIDAEVDYESAYHAVMSALEPRWGGSKKARETFAKQCAETDRYDTTIPGVYYDFVTEVGQGAELSKRLRANPEMYVTVQRCLRGMIDAPLRQANQGKSVQQVRLLTNALLNAIRADELEDAKQLWEELGEDASSIEAAEIFNSIKMDPAYEKSRGHAYSEFAEQLKVIEPLTVRRDAGYEISKVVNEVYRELLARGSPEARRYLETWVRITDQEMKFHEGEWVDLKFDDAVNTWVRNGDWNFVDKTTVNVDNLLGDHLTYIHSRSVFPDPIEMEVQLDAPKRRMMPLGILRADPKQRIAKWVIFGAPLGGGTAAMSNWKLAYGKFETPPPQKIEVMSWGKEYVEFRVNGVVVPSHNLPTLSDDSTLVGLGQFFWRNGKYEASFSNFRIRRIPYDAPPPLADDSARIDYFTNALQRYPSRLDYQRQRGVAYYGMEQWESAMADLQSVRGKLLSNVNMWTEYLVGNIHLKLDQNKLGEDTLMALYRNVPEQPDAAQAAFGFGAACDVVEFLATSDPSNEGNLKRALKLAKEVLGKHKECSAYIALARAQFALGKVDASQKSLKKARALATTDHKADQVDELQAQITGTP
ncbi:tetratricopeptide repeat protein [Neorhodopirellula lusitana]|uniref:tetratricopeptide repeat protein n=1 Tax=Neorhodopirellula lusitana TaxID=445327 RepID=UPI00384DA09B